MNIILASGSPRRKELLKIIFSDFEVKPSGTKPCPKIYLQTGLQNFLLSKKQNLLNVIRTI